MDPASEKHTRFGLVVENGRVGTLLAGGILGWHSLCMVILRWRLRAGYVKTMGVNETLDNYLDVIM
jgi:hypothetical protein